jgi:hypothetical protein
VQAVGHGQGFLSIERDAAIIIAPYWRHIKDRPFR